MVYEKREARWRAWLTEDERQRIAEIDATEFEISRMRIERRMIANRALQRARYAEKTALQTAATDEVASRRPRIRASSGRNNPELRKREKTKP